MEFHIANNNFAFRAKPIPKNVINETKSELLKDNINVIDIFCHSCADEDTINSAKVFSNWLSANGKKVNICVPKSEVLELYFNNKEYNIKKDLIPADKAVVLDFNSAERIPTKYKDLYSQNSSKNVIGYDHHNPGDNFLEGKLYIDDTAKSCCGVLTRFFEAFGQKLNKKDTKSLYCGMVSDYKKSGLIDIKNEKGVYSLQKTDKLLSDKNSLEVFNKLDESLSSKEKISIYKHLDPLSRLTSDEKFLRNRLFSDIKVSPNGKMAYVVIPPNDELWAKVGMDTSKTSEILKDIRVRISDNSQMVDELTNEQKNKMKNVDTVVAFYRKSDAVQDEYRMSIHSKSNSALKMIKYIKENLNPNIIAGGHEDRAGGKINSIDEKDAQQFVADFVKASSIL